MFSGYILPKTVNLTVYYKPSLSWKDTENNCEYHFEFKIENSLIEVKVEVEEFNSVLLPEIYRRVLDLARAQIDLVAFNQGIGFNLHFDFYRINDGEKNFILLHDSKLKDFCSAFDLKDNYNKICDLTLKNPSIFMCLRELIEAISVPHISVVNIARGIERLKQIISNEQNNDKRAWELFRSELNIDKDYIKFITDNSKEVRHGKSVRISGDITTEITHRGWIILNRYFEYMLNDFNKLDSERYKLLK